jgi:RNA polymerase sigma-70 factor (ECF subfamily)
MRNASFDMLRKMQTQREEMLSDDIWPLVEAQTAEEGEYTDHLMQKEIQRYLSLLPDAQQQVIKGVYFQHLSQEELAKQLGIPVGTVKSRLRIALCKLKQKMGGKL